MAGTWTLAYNGAARNWRQNAPRAHARTPHNPRAKFDFDCVRLGPNSDQQCNDHNQIEQMIDQIQLLTTKLQRITSSHATVLTAAISNTDSVVGTHC